MLARIDMRKGRGHRIHPERVSYDLDSEAEKVLPRNCGSLLNNTPTPCMLEKQQSSFVSRRPNAVAKVDEDRINASEVRPPPNVVINWSF